MTKTAYSQPADQLPGAQTYVKEPSSRTPGNDNTEKQQVLPSPPNTRSKPNSGNPQFNKPPGSDDALDDKPLHSDRARTLSKPGEDSPPNDEPSYGTVTRRPGLSAAVTGPQYPGTHREHEQEGDAARYTHKYYEMHHNKIKNRSERWNKKHENQDAYKKDRARREKDPQKFKRAPSNYHDPADRSRDWREEHKESMVDRVAARYADFLYEKRGPDKEPGQNFDRASPAHHLWPEHEPGPDLDVGEVNDNPGSAKVIPEGHDFENKKDRTFKESSLRVALRMMEIQERCGAKVQNASRGVAIKLKRVDAANNMWMFDVPGSQGTYKVRVKAFAKGNVTDVNKMDIHVSCTCPFWRWQGPEHWATKNGYLYGKPAGTATAPVQKDPHEQHWACKHVLAVLNKVRTFKPGGHTNKTASDSLRLLADSLTFGGDVIMHVPMSVRVAGRYLARQGR